MSCHVPARGIASPFPRDIPIDAVAAAIDTVSCGGAPAPGVLRRWGGSVKRIRFLLLAVPTLLAMFSVAITPAAAAAPVPFTIDTHVDFNTGGVFTFTATGPLCASGTFVDNVTVVAPGPATAQGPGVSGGVNLQIRSVYTCADGSGTWNQLSMLFLTFGPNDSFTNTGPVQILGGTGKYAGATGHGFGTGGTDSTGIGGGQTVGVISLR